MHIDDIASLKPFGNYTADTSLSFLVETIDKWIEEDLLLLHPDFQRGRIWTPKQKIAFVEFLLKGGKTSPLLFNHPGWMKSFEGDFVCVDGLQRITAITEFINNKLAVFNGHLRKDIEGIDKLLRSITVKYYINDLKTRAEVLEWYIELNSGGTPHTQKEIDRVRDLLEKSR